MTTKVDVSKFYRYVNMHILFRLAFERVATNILAMFDIV